MTSLNATLVGESGFERATVWCAVGFALTAAAFEAAARFGAPPTDWLLVVCVSLTAVAAIAFARIGGGVGPTVLLAFGPFAGALVGPFVGALIGPFDTVPAVASPLESFGIAVLAATAAGVASYLIGRALASSERTALS